MQHSIALIPPRIPLFSPADPASQHSPSFCPFTSIPPYPVPPSMPASLTPCITLAAIGSAVGPLPSAGRPPRGESVCHSRLMPCSLTDQLLLVWNLSPLWRGPDRGGDAIPTHCHSGGLARETAIHTFNLPDSVTMERWDAVGEKGSDSSASAGE